MVFLARRPLRIEYALHVSGVTFAESCLKKMFRFSALRLRCITLCQGYCIFGYLTFLYRVLTKQDKCYWQSVIHRNLLK